jgi:hypothetical protein
LLVSVEAGRSGRNDEGLCPGDAVRSGIGLKSELLNHLTDLHRALEIGGAAPVDADQDKRVEALRQVGVESDDVIQRRVTFGLVIIDRQAVEERVLRAEWQPI